MEEKEESKVKKPKKAEPVATPDVQAKVTEPKSMEALEALETRALELRVENDVPQIFSEAQRNLLKNETPRYKIKKRKGKAGMFFDYVDIGYVLEQLNILTGHRWDFDVLWQTSIEECKQVGQFIIRGTLTLYGKDGIVVRKTNYGKADIKEKTSGGFLDFGNDMKAAASDCVKKCASMFGVALDVYSGSVQRRQDLTHPEAKITESQRRRLEVLAGEASVGHSGLKKIINEMYDYTSTEDIQRRHFDEISARLEGMSGDLEIVEIPADIKQGFDILGTTPAKQTALFKSYSKEGKIDELRKKISAKVDEQTKK